MRHREPLVSSDRGDQHARSPFRNRRAAVASASSVPQAFGRSAPVPLPTGSATKAMPEVGEMCELVLKTVETQRDAERLVLTSRITSSARSVKFALQMLHQWDQCPHADPRKIGRQLTRSKYRRCEISRSDSDGTLSPIRQFNHHKGGTAARSFLQYRKPMAKEAMPRIGDRCVSFVPIKDCRIGWATKIPAKSLRPKM